MGLEKAKIELPKEEYIQEKQPDGRVIIYCTMRQKALHIIGLDNCRKRPYTRHGKKFYRPYRNYFYAPEGGDKDLEKLAEAGYLDREVTHEGTDREGVWYEYNRKGLDWLGQQLGITIYDPE